MAKPKKEEFVQKKEERVQKKVKKHSRRNIRKIMKNVDLSELTKIAVRNERERKSRIQIRGENVRSLILLFSSFKLFVLSVIFCVFS